MGLFEKIEDVEIKQGNRVAYPDFQEGRAVAEIVMTGMKTETKKGSGHPYFLSYRIREGLSGGFLGQEGKVFSWTRVVSVAYDPKARRLKLTEYGKKDALEIKKVVMAVMGLPSEQVDEDVIADFFGVDDNDAPRDDFDPETHAGTPFIITVKQKVHTKKDADGREVSKTYTNQYFDVYEG